MTGRRSGSPWAGDLDVCTAETLVVFARNATEDGAFQQVLVDLAAVTFLDAAGVSALLRGLRTTSKPSAT